MEETLSSVSVLVTVEEPLCQLLPDRFAQDAACWRTSLCRCDSEGRLFFDVCRERVRVCFHSLHVRAHMPLSA